VTDKPTVVLCHVADDAEALHCSPDEWLRGAARFIAEGVTLVRLESIPDGSPWDDEEVWFDPHAGTWSFDPWPGVAFVLPLDE